VTTLPPESEAEQPRLADCPLRCRSGHPADGPSQARHVQQRWPIRNLGPPHCRQRLTRAAASATLEPRSPEAGSDVVPDSLDEEDVSAPGRAALQRELWTRPAAHRDRADAASANHPARACLPPEAAGSPGGGTTREDEIVCSGVSSCSRNTSTSSGLPVTPRGLNSASQPRPRRRSPTISSSARSAPKRRRRCSRSYEPRGKIQRSPASHAWQEAREAVSRRSVSRSDAS
jgi:hypothetical protein